METNQFEPEYMGLRHLSSIIEKYGQDYAAIQIINLSSENLNNINLSVSAGEVLVVISDKPEIRSEFMSLVHEGINENSESIIIPHDAIAISVNTQSSEFYPEDTTIYDYFLDARELMGVEKKLMSLYDKMAEGAHTEEEVSELHALMDANNGWDTFHEIDKILSGLNFGNLTEEYLKNTPLNEVSSGQTLKLALARALYSKANIILLTDPELHLDAPSREWLEEYLDASQQSLIVSTSDMVVASNVATKVVEITSSGDAIIVRGNMLTFWEERQKIIDGWVAEKSRYQEEIEKLEKDVARLKQLAQNSETMARRKNVQLAKLEKLKNKYETLPAVRMNFEYDTEKVISFEKSKQESTKVLSVQETLLHYVGHEENDIHIPNIEIFKGERVAVIGLNGSGKSTLINYILGISSGLNSPENSSSIGPGVKHQYYGPYLDTSSSKATVYQYIHEDEQNNKISSKILHYWGIDRDLCHQKIFSITAKDIIARISFARIMMSKPNFILLDEPTAYTTPSYKQKLIMSLKDYDGTLLVVSHDSDFLNNLNISNVLSLPSGEYKSI